MKLHISVPLILAALGFAGCAGHTHSLVPDVQDQGLSIGTFRHGGPEGPTMILEFGGKRFEARSFAIKRSQNLNELLKRYGPGKHYDQIFSAIDSDHYVYTSEPELRSSDGAILRCSLVWAGNNSPAGYCTSSEGARVDIHFE